jgi:hypothetical protein
LQERVLNSHPNTFRARFFSDEQKGMENGVDCDTVYDNSMIYQEDLA